jgi:predicted  nucleic acid-binding Zn-ribbon protein
MSKNKKNQSKKTYQFISHPYRKMYKQATIEINQLRKEFDQATNEIDQLKKEIDQLKKTIEIQESIISHTKNITEEEYIKNDVVGDIYNNIILIDDYFTNMGYDITQHLKKFNYKN